MGIFGAMSTSITGLKAQSYALENISNNIANSQTTGYKRTETTFAEFLPESNPRQQRIGVVQAFSRPTNQVQGDIQNSSISTHVAINGDGYFVVSQQTGTVDGEPILSDEDLYTRRGDFELDRFGYLVNASGYYLKGLPVDPVTGNISGSLPEVIQVSNDFLAANATTEIDYRLNLPNYPKTANADPTIADSELFDGTGLTNYNALTGQVSTVLGSEVGDFLDQTLSGGAVTAYDPAGAPVNVQFRWAKLDTMLTGGTDTWNLFYLSNSAATGAQPAWTNIGEDYVFGANGQLTSGQEDVSLTALTVDGITVGDVLLRHGIQGVTQFSNSAGVTSVTELDQDGFAAGEFVGVSITNEGRVAATYTNGRTIDVADVTLAAFNADGYLQKLDGGAYRALEDAGFPILGAQGQIVSQSLESSNTDIADEFTKLIVTQQAYAANTRVVSTSDEMMQEALNMIR